MNCGGFVFLDLTDLFTNLFSNVILNLVGKYIGKKVGKSDVDRPVLNPRRQTILLEIKQNPYVTKHELSEIIGISTTAIDNNIAYLRNNGFIERVGKTKGGYWKVIE